MQKVQGIAVYLNILRSSKERMWVELEDGKNGRIKDRLLNKIIQDIKKINKQIWTYKRLSGIVFFVKGSVQNEKYVYKILQEIYTISRKNVKLFNKHFKKGELFKDSYGAEFSEDNILLDFNNHKEIIGLAINVAFKIAEHKDNQESMYIGKELTKHSASYNLQKKFNAIENITYLAYFKKIKMDKFIKISEISKFKGKPKQKDDGVIYFNIDIRHSTKALMIYDVEDIAKRFKKILEKVSGFFKALKFKSQFKGDGILFWKLKMAKKIKTYVIALSFANKLAYSQEYAQLSSVRKLRVLKKTSFTAEKSYKIKIGIDAAKKYFYTSPEEPPISPHRVLSEIAEKVVTKDYKIVSGESFLQKLYMNDQDYVKLAKRINKYNLYFITNNYLIKSAKKNTKWKIRVWSKGQCINLEEYYIPGQSFVKQFGKEAKKAKQINKKPAFPQMPAKYNGLHFYISKKGLYLPIFVNDNKRGFKEYEK